jgi:hypothetical protein
MSNSAVYQFYVSQYPLLHPLTSLLSLHNRTPKRQTFRNSDCRIFIVRWCSCARPSTAHGIWIHEVGSQENVAAHTSSSNLISMYFTYQLRIWKTLMRSVLLHYLSEWRFEPTPCNIFIFPSSFMMLKSLLFKESELFYPFTTGWISFLFSEFDKGIIIR